MRRDTGNAGIPAASPFFHDVPDLAFGAAAQTAAVDQRRSPAAFFTALAKASRATLCEQFFGLLLLVRRRLAQGVDDRYVYRTSAEESVRVLIGFDSPPMIYLKSFAQPPRRGMHEPCRYGIA